MRLRLPERNPLRHDGRVRLAALLFLAALTPSQTPATGTPQGVEPAPVGGQTTPQRQIVREPIPPAAGEVVFRNRASTFQLHVPEGWRQLAPAEVRAVRAAAKSMPYDLRQNEPTLFYGVGPVDRWLEGEFDGVYLYVVEQDAEWHLEGELAARLQHMWDHKGERDGQRYTVLRAERTPVGFDAHPAVLAERRIEPVGGRAQRSLDVHVPTGGRELTLCLTCWDDEFAAREAFLRHILGTLSFARPPRGEVTLSDRLLTPALVGAGVGLVFVVLYRRSRRAPV